MSLQSVARKVVGMSVVAASTISLCAGVNAFAATAADSDHVVGVNTTTGGETKCYAIARSSVITAPRGSLGENLRVRIPVAIHYVADSEGNLQGPSDDVVAIVNETVGGAVHVSGMSVDDEGDATLMLCSEAADVNDAVGFTMTPEGGSSIDLADYADDSDTASPSFKEPSIIHDWDIGAKSSDDNTLCLNQLTGVIGGYDALDPSIDEHVGTIHWRIKAGTRSESDARDGSIEVHYNPGIGSFTNGVPIPDDICRVIKEVNEDGVISFAIDMDALSQPLNDGTGVTPPSERHNIDGSVTRWVFSGWYDKLSEQDENGFAEHISTFGDFGLPENTAGKVFEVWAHFEPHTFIQDGSGSEVEVDAIP